MSINPRAWLLAIFICSQVLTACAYQQISPTPSATQAAVGTGDTVRVTTQNGEQYVFEVTQITATGLSGEEGQFAYAQMAQLERQSVNQPMIWLAVGLGVAAAAGGGGGSSY